MKLFALIVVIGGHVPQAEHMSPYFFNDIKSCSTAGARAQTVWSTMFNEPPSEYSYRCVPVDMLTAARK